ncbi:MAK10-like protein [Tanacetum coccineum]
MGDENPIRTLGDYSKPSHEGYRNTIELPAGNNVVPLRSDTIWLVQNGCSFHGVRYEDPNQHLKDFLKLVDSLDLDGANRGRTRLRLFQFSLRDQASNWLERLPAGSITTWEDLTTRFLAQFFPPGRTAKLRNDILMFQQHHGESLSEAWTRFKDLLQKVPHHGIDLWLQLRDRNAEESWALLEDLALYDNESWNDPRDFAKPVKAITLPQDVPSTSDRRLIEIENQIQRLTEAHLASTQPTQVNKITSSCEICSGPHDTQYYMEDPQQAFVEYASSRTDEAGGLVSNFMAFQDARLSKFEADFKQQQSEMTNKIDTVLKAITDRITGTLPSDTVKNPKLSTYPVLSACSYPTEDPQCSTQTHGSINVITIYTEQQSASYNDGEKENKEEGDNPENIHIYPPKPPDPSVTFITEKVFKFNSFFESLGLVPPSSNTELICTKGEDGDVMFIEIFPKDDNSRKEEPKAGEQEVEYFDVFPTRSELAYHKYLMCGPIPSIFLRNPIIMEGFPSNLKIPCNIGHVHIMRRKLDPRENANGVSNFTGRIKGMHVFVGNFTYIVDFMIIEDINSIIDPRLSQVVLGKPFVEISNMTHDPPEGVVRFTNGDNEVAYKIEQYESLSNLEKEHTKSVYLRNEEDKRRGVEYVMSKILGFYKKCLELRPEYLTRMDDEGEVT